MKPGKTLDRKRGVRKEQQRVLVATEGIRTEVQYFELLRQHLSKSGIRHLPVKPVGVGRDPLSVLRAALDLRDKDDDAFDSIWIAVDVDQHHSLEECLREAAKEGVSVVVSNPCFEIWLLWHKVDYARHLQDNEVKSVMKKNGIVGKALPVDFPVAAYEDAIRRSRQARGDCAPGSVGANPSSGMHALICYLTNDSRPGTTNRADGRREPTSRKGTR